MNTLRIPAIALIFIFLISCQKSISVNHEEIVSEEKVITPKDSCSYTIDGITYGFSGYASFGRGTGGAKLDTVTGEWHPDTLYYSNIYRLIPANFLSGGSIEISFIKHYHRNQLSVLRTGISGPVSELELYNNVDYKYALDFKRHNLMEGIALDVRFFNAGKSETLCSYIHQSWKTPTNISYTAQANSGFNITKMEKLKDGGYILEATFSAVVFDRNEIAKKLENGYLRLLIQ
jgi:hypothetical protein